MSSRNKSLEELEGFQSQRSFGTELSQHVLRVRRVPLSELSLGDLRLLISQTEGIEYIVPLAIEALEQNPWLEADHYAGDLLAALVRLHQSHWPGDASYRERMAVVITRALEDTAHLGADQGRRIEADLRAASERFGTT